MKNILGTSWRTNLGGVLALLSSIGAGAKLLAMGNYNFNDPLWLAVFTGVASAWTGFSARDNKVTSEQAAAKQ